MLQQRDHFRLVFPLGQRPCLAAGMAEWDVIDLSEEGAKIAVNGESSLCSGEAFAATIRFHDGMRAAVTASVHRRENDHVILHFGDPLSYSLIMAEQRRLLRLFPRDGLIGPATGAQQSIPQTVMAAP